MAFETVLMSQNSRLNLKNITYSNMMGEIDFRRTLSTHLAALNNLSAVQNVSAIKSEVI